MITVMLGVTGGIGGSFLIQGSGSLSMHPDVECMCVIQRLPHDLWATCPCCPGSHAPLLLICVRSHSIAVRQKGRRPRPLILQTAT